MVVATPHGKQNDKLTFYLSRGSRILVIHFIDEFLSLLVFITHILEIFKPTISLYKFTKIRVGMAVNKTFDLTQYAQFKTYFLFVSVFGV